MREVIETCLEELEEGTTAEFVGVQKVIVWCAESHSI